MKVWTLKLSRAEIVELFHCLDNAEGNGDWSQHLVETYGNGKKTKQRIEALHSGISKIIELQIASQ